MEGNREAGEIVGYVGPSLIDEVIGERREERQVDVFSQQVQGEIVKYIDEQIVQKNPKVYARKFGRSKRVGFSITVPDDNPVEGLLLYREDGTLTVTIDGLDRVYYFSPHRNMVEYLRRVGPERRRNLRMKDLFQLRQLLQQIRQANGL